MYYTYLFFCYVLYLSIFFLSIAGTDLVLGASWLAMLGPHVVDFSNLTLKFYIDGDCSSNVLLSYFYAIIAFHQRVQQMDFITNLSNFFGFTVSMIVVDLLSKYGHFTTLKIYYNSKMVAEVFMQNIVKLHGMFKSTVLYRDKIFTSQFWQHLLKFSGTSLSMSLAYHQQSDDQSEVLNKCLEIYLICLTFWNPTNWSKVLAWT